MVAVKQSGLAREVQRRGDELRLVLIHGSDSERVRSLAGSVVEAVCGSKDDPFRVQKLSWTGIGGNASRIFEEVLSLSLTGGRRTIWLTEGRESTISAITPLLSGEVTGNLVVIECESLPKSSILRAEAEAHAAAACVAIYDADPDEISFLVESASAGFGLALTPGAKELLLELSSGNQSLLNREIEKLALYCGPAAIAKAEDVEKACGDGVQFSIEDVVDAIFSGNIGEVERATVRLMEEGIALGRVLSSALEHVFKLQTLTMEVRRGVSIDAVLRSPRQQIYFKRRAAIKGQLHLWDMGMLQKAGRLLGTAVANARRNSRLELAIATRSLMSVAYLCRRVPSG